MDFRRLINLTLAVLVTIGLTLASPTAAAPARSAGMSDTSVSENMPCCPPEQKSKDCQDCPLIAMCILKTVQAGPSETAALPLRHAIRSNHLFADDVLGDGLVRPPPDHPPRT
jgi:hypothetical protein